jgi:hypothetical protein
MGYDCHWKIPLAPLDGERLRSAFVAAADRYPGTIVELLPSGAGLPEHRLCRLLLPEAEVLARWSSPSRKKPVYPPDPEGFYEGCIDVWDEAPATRLSMRCHSDAGGNDDVFTILYDITQRAAEALGGAEEG